ncbi:MAG: DUF1592 domain-containing protein [Verrucomicrobia bacterium]|nr:DUF1592 domain-containing protein [Verrucomicrobiota bacterium]
MDLNPRDAAVWAGGFLATWLALPVAAGVSRPEAGDYSRDIQPLITRYCADCHADGANKGGVAFDQLAVTNGVPGSGELWHSVLKNVRAGLMPPFKKEQPTAEERRRLETWIKYGALGLDPAHPDPGRVTLRRLNRVEYRNTIRDLMGVDFRTDEEFPPDDTGHGFDNLGEVLTLSPLLLEKYLKAAQAIVEQAVPKVSSVPAEVSVAGRRFRKPGDSSPGGEGPLSLPYGEAATVQSGVEIAHAGDYQVVVELNTSEKFVDDACDYNRCRLVFRVDGEEVARQEFAREGDRSFRLEATRHWTPGNHRLTLGLEPLTPGEKPVRSLALRIHRVVVRGPMDPGQWVRPANHARFFPEGVPVRDEDRRPMAAAVLGDFATRAFRRPVDAATLDRLVALSGVTDPDAGRTFEAGVAQAMTAVLASPRFLFLEEAVEPADGESPHRRLDEPALAARLSYFLWSSMPDDTLRRLVSEGRLRQELPAQVQRMLADPKSAALLQNFPGQWLQSRDIESVVIDSRTVLGREEKPDPERERKRARFRKLREREPATLSEDEKDELARIRSEIFRPGGQRAELSGDLRRAMRRETEMVFELILRENRSVLEFLDADYTFLNERLARHYGLTNLSVAGDEMRRVSLPADSVRGGVLTQGTVLAVTSNPTRTSPVKRGVFLLDNLLGTPAPPAPPDVPSLEEKAPGGTNGPVSLRASLEQHRNQPLCRSCHQRMDPLGLALEPFNAMGMWRDQEFGLPLEADGQLITGESFSDVRGLKRILATERRMDFLRCLSEKLLTYALGRGLGPEDVETVDRIVARLDASGGRMGELINAIVESAAFQQRREVSRHSSSSPP